jgi:sec-independent protein translocase protein TatA
MLIVLVLFGAGKLPSVMKDLAKGIKSFKEGLKSSNNKDDDEDEDKII